MGVARMLKFDDVLKLRGDGGVEAMGPVDPKQEHIIELCAWVFQRRSSDAAATEMGTLHGDHHGGGHGGTGHVKIVHENGQDKWQLPLGRVGDEELKPGDAFGVAVAITHNASGEQTVVWWGHPLELAKA
jgi:hypothetical protein